MTERIQEEFERLQNIFKESELKENWVLLSNYRLTKGLGWNKEMCPICFQFPVGYPGTPPYGFYAPADISCNGQVPDNFQGSPQNIPPFPGPWSFFSWTPEDGQWKASSDVNKGSNIINFIHSFDQRFRMGK
jgi:hypothetical protein